MTLNERLLAHSPGRLRYPQSRRTRCPQGHLYDEENTYLMARRKTGGFRLYRKCRACARERKRVASRGRALEVDDG